MQIEGPIEKEEATAAMFQALGMLLMEFQKDRKVDHLSFDFNNFNYKVGVRPEGLIDLEKHNIEPIEPAKPKILTIDEFKNGL